MRVLVTYSSKKGATAEIAETVADELSRMGHLVVLRPVAEANDLTGVDAVVLGSAIYFGKWRKDAIEFGRRHADALRGRPVWMFDSGPLDASPDGGKTEPVEAAEALAREIGARERITFGGRLEIEDAGLFMRRLMKSGRVGSYGDFRNLARVRVWAASIGAALTERPARPETAEERRAIASEG